MKNVILSIDWDHTLRKTSGIDLTILGLMFYAEAARIPFGITTHRDKENTTLYMYSPWLYPSSEDIDDALAASIAFWQENLFLPLNLKLDFINARYQPLFKNENYYETQLLSLEIELQNEILNQKISNNRAELKAQIEKYAIKSEFHLPQNDYKEKQIAWLYEQYRSSFSGPITIIHLDDDQGVTDQLPLYFSQFSNGLFKVNTVYLDDEHTLSNAAFLSLLTDMGVGMQVQTWIEQSYIEEDQSSQADLLLLMSACLLSALLYYLNKEKLVKLEKVLEKIAFRLPDKFQFRYFFIKSCVSAIIANQVPIRLLSNNLKYFIV